MKKVIAIIAFFLGTPVLILLLVLYLSFYTFNKGGNFLSLRSTPMVAYAALPSIDTQITPQITQSEARVEMVKSFLTKYHSPLLPYAQKIVDDADKYGLDYRLIPAIGMQESNLCLKAPINSNNCWGFGIYGGKITRFSDYNEAIDTVTRTLAVKYKGNGLVTPEEIMTMYTPSSNGSWAASVKQFMAELQ